MKRTSLFSGLSVAIVVAMASVSAAMAAEVVLTQKDKAFDKSEITLNKGDSIKFVNADTIAHNVHSRSGEKFDLGVQKPGDSSSHTFASDGTFKVRCAIHPKMKVEVTVK